MTPGSEWVSFMRDLAAVSALGAVAIHLIKLRWPSYEWDTFSYLAIGLATAASLVAITVGVVVAHAVAPWAFFCLVPVGLYWLIEFEFATRFNGLLVGMIVLAGTVFWRAGIPVPLGPGPAWSALSALAAIGAAGLGAFAALMALPALLLHTGSTLTVRRTARFWAVTAPAIEEMAYRLMAWGIPFLAAAFCAGILALGRREAGLGALVALALALALSVGYLVWTRLDGRTLRWRPWIRLGAIAAELLALQQLHLFP